MKRLDPDVRPDEAKKYGRALKSINAAELPYLVGGGLSFSYHTDYPRTFKDLDIFCKAGDYPKILDILEKQGYTISVPDEKWLAKATDGTVQIDLLFSSPNGAQTVDDTWFRHSDDVILFGESVKIMSAEELFWCKVYVQNTDRFDGPDINHLILKSKSKLNWRMILQRMEADWEVLLGALINYRFVFPSERSRIPQWLMEDLRDRLVRQMEMPESQDRVCRGPLLARADYLADIQEGGFII